MQKIKHVQQNETWTCAVCSCAMLLGTTKEKIMEELKEINEKLLLANQYLEELYADGYDPPGIGMDEFIKIANKYGFVVGTYDLEPFKITNIKKLLKDTQGIIVIPREENFHAVVWDGEKVLYPDEGVKTLEDADKDGLVTYYRFLKISAAAKPKAKKKLKKTTNKTQTTKKD